MKQILFLLLLLCTLGVSAQDKVITRQTYGICGKAISQCRYKGNHLL